MTSPVDEGDLRARLERISELFCGIAAQAQGLAQTRCPYRDRFDRCTGKFRCRNQVRAEGSDPQGPSTCTHDGRFDYRSAWQTHPRAYEKAKAEIRGIKGGAERRRRGGGGGAQ